MCSTFLHASILTCYTPEDAFYHIFQASWDSESPPPLKQAEELPFFLNFEKAVEGEANSKACIVRGKAEKSTEKKSRPEKLGDLKLGKTSMAAVVGAQIFTDGICSM